MSKKTKPMPEQTLTVKFKEDRITLSLPTNGQLIDIERRKINLSGSKHSEMLNLMTRSSLYAYTIVEMIATLEVIIPDFKNRLKGIDSLLDLNPLETSELNKVYVDEIFPWLEKWRDYINHPYEEESDNEE